MENPFKILDNAAFVLNLLVSKLKVKVSSFTVEREVMLHPSYPSLLAYTDCLDSWKIPNVAYQVDKTSFEIDELSGGFVAHVKTLGGQFVWVEGISADRVILSDHKSSKRIVSRDEFYKSWDGILLFAEKDDNSGEENYYPELIKGWLTSLQFPLIALVLMIFLFFNLSPGQHISYYFLLLIKCFGLGISFVLLMHGINNANPFIQNLCGLGKKNDCNAILKSEGAKITSWLTWSEVGMFYFVGTFSAIIMNHNNIVYLSYINILALPYTFYSITYQFRARTWCVLCCAVQTILWLEAIIFFADSQASYHWFNPNKSNLLALVACFLVPVMIWYFLKPFFYNAATLKMTTQQLNRYKYDTALFEKSLHSQPRYSIGADLKLLTIGNADASNIITMVSNPFCNPCGIAHKTIEGWLASRNDIQLKVIFLTGSHHEDPRTIIAGHINALMLNDGVKSAGLALSDWYDTIDKDIESWKGRYPVGEEIAIDDVVKIQKDWCAMADITYTPTIFVNGYKLPLPYRVEDLKYLLD